MSGKSASRKRSAFAHGSEPSRPQGGHVYEGRDGEVWVDGQPLDPARHVRSYSPTGFDWGARTAGAFQLAVAILTHEFGSSFALTYAARFKRDVVWHLPPAWVLSSDYLIQWRIAVAAPREVPTPAASERYEALITCHDCRAYMQTDQRSQQPVCPRCLDCEDLGVLAREGPPRMMAIYDRAADR